jgi:somatic embryogenesis receptor kinase 1
VWQLILIQRLKTLDLFLNMDSKRQLLLRWFPATIIFLVSFVDMGVALTPDGLALLDFKHSLTTTSPLLQNWRASDVSPCSWGGIKCTAGGNVQNITLSSQVPMLEGNISSSLGRLKSLQALMLDHNLLSGSIPPELGNLSNLLTLSLSNNSLSGEIPPQLGRCMSLVELWLDGNVLRGTIPESLSNLKN